MNDGVDAFNRFGKDILLGEIIHLYELEPVVVSGPGINHGFAFLQRSGRTAHPYSFGEKAVDNMGTNEAGGTGNKDIFSGYRVSLSQQMRSIW